MIYVSSSCVKAKYICDAVIALAEMGYKNIELSGGTSPYPEMEKDLIELREKRGLNYLLHNYFPPPQKAFVVNLAALDTETSEATFSHLKNALELCKRLGCVKFGFHAGFLINIPMEEMGKEIKARELFDKNKSMQVFCERFNELMSAYPEIQLYLENNVLSETNYKNFGNVNPFFFTDVESMKELQQSIEFGILLDTGHLKVSCHSLDLDFDRELDAMISQSDYIHISDNDALRDGNEALVRHSSLFEKLSRYSWKGKTVTLEVYQGEQALRESYESVKELMK